MSRLILDSAPAGWYILFYSRIIQPMSPPKIKYRTFTSSDGFTVLVGKSSFDNDRLTLEVADALDLWLHVDGFSGSHVVVQKRADCTGFPHTTLKEAAALAAYYSKAREAKFVSVHYCLAGNVYKVKGAPDGQVHIENFKLIKVKPELTLEEVKAPDSF